MTLQIWAEKYRPRTLNQVRGQEDITSRLQAFVSSKNMPHLMFSGPAGVGKTTSALAIAHELYGENWREHVLELNASDERGIDVIRDKVKDFARTKALEEAPFKLIYLDEADALTKEAQHALRRTMEDYATTTRFILSCNYSSKIISPIQSRCAVFRFRPLPKDVSIKLLQDIAREEGYAVDANALEFIYQYSEGDMRKAENMLQSCTAVVPPGEKKSDGSITPADRDGCISLAILNQVVSFAEPQEIADILAMTLRGEFSNAKNKLTDVMIKHGLSGMDVIKQIQQQIWHVNVPDKLKIELIRRCGEYEFRLVEGSNEFIQLSAMLADFCSLNR